MSWIITPEQIKKDDKIRDEFCGMTGKNIDPNIPDNIYDSRRMKFKRMIAVDFDNTIVDSRYPEIFGVKDGAREALKKFKEMGLHIIVHTARVSSYWARPEQFVKNSDFTLQGAVNIVQDYLIKNNLPFDEIWQGKGKPPCWLEVDDRSITFRDNWPEITEYVEQKFSEIKG
jgi:hypothetical protein